MQLLNWLAQHETTINYFWWFTLISMAVLYFVCNLLPDRLVGNILPLHNVFRPKKNVDLDYQSIGYAIMVCSFPKLALELSGDGIDCYADTITLYWGFKIWLFFYFNERSYFYWLRLCYSLFRYARCRTVIEGCLNDGWLNQNDWTFSRTYSTSFARRI